jgi:hypothetical protein
MHYNKSNILKLKYLKMQKAIHRTISIMFFRSYTHLLKHRMLFIWNSTTRENLITELPTNIKRVNGFKVIVKPINTLVNDKKLLEEAQENLYRQI